MMNIYLSMVATFDIVTTTDLCDQLILFWTMKYVIEKGFSRFTLLPQNMTFENVVLYQFYDSLDTIQHTNQGL